VIKVFEERLDQTVTLVAVACVMREKISNPNVWGLRYSTMSTSVI
jgi:hypothetical protein